jgi:hypothetical protein
MNEWLEAHSHVYVAGRLALRQVLAFDEADRWGIAPALSRSGLSERRLVETIRLVNRIARDTRAAGSRLLVLVIPIRIQVLDPRAASLHSRFPTLRDDLDMDLVSHSFIPRVADVPGVDRVVDLLPYLRAHAGKDAWGQRDPHFSSRGHELWFQAIRGAVENLLESP